MTTQRKIIHIDMDAFFASIEQRDNLELQGKAIAVGSSSERGVVATCSYEARKFGVHSAMSSVVAKRLCPDLIFVRPHFDVYEAVSHQIMSIFREFTDKIEPLSIDEAFLDVTENLVQQTSATEIAKLIKKRILDETGLTASAGVSFNKFLAKIASDMQKPNGITVVRPEEAEAFVEKLPIEKFYGIGKVTAEKMHRYGIHTGKDLKLRELHELTRLFGKSGLFFYSMARAIHEREVKSSHIRKSVGAEITFEKDLTTKFERIAELYKIEQEVFERVKEANFKGKTITLKVKFHNFEQITRSKTINGWFTSFDNIHKYAKELLLQTYLDDTKVRLLGLSISNAEEEGKDGIQLTLKF